MSSKRENSYEDGYETYEEPSIITAKDPKKVAQGKWLASVSKKAKKDKLRKEIMEEEFSYLPYILYPLAGISTFLLIAAMFRGRKEVVKYEYVPITKETEEKIDKQIEEKKDKTRPKTKFETLG